MIKVIKRLLVILMIVLSSVAVSAPAEAHVSYCKKTVSVPERYGIPDRIVGYARARCPRDGHHSYVSVDAWLEVYAPRWNAWGDGDWRRVGQVWQDDDYYNVIAAPNTALLYGKNKYRTRAVFVVHGHQGERRYDIKTSGREFTRYKHR